MLFTRRNKKMWVERLKLFAGAVSVFFVGGLSGTLHSAEHPTAPPKQDWSFHGPFGTYDRAALQRGFQVYKQVCSACHSMHQLSYRNLRDLGFSKAEVKAIAKAYDVPGGINDEGEPFTKSADPHDRFFSPYPNDQAGRAANNGALPPDLSLMTKARAHGADYVKALLTGYREPPAGIHIAQGMHYNLYFPGHQIAMAPPLQEGIVAYSDGTKATTEQMASDVVTFLSWAAEPELEQRNRMGVRVFIFLGVFFVFMFALYKRTWRGIKK